MNLPREAGRQLKKVRQDHPNSPGYDGKQNLTSFREIQTKPSPLTNIQKPGPDYWGNMRAGSGGQGLTVKCVCSVQELSSKAPWRLT